jgi:hypothetical protein
MPGGINRKTRERLRSIENENPNVRIQREDYQIDAGWKRLMTPPAEFVERIDARLNMLHIQKPAERRKLHSACLRVWKRAQVRRFELAAAEGTIERDKERVQEILYGKKIPIYFRRTSSKGEYLRNIDRARERMQRARAHLIEETRKLISNPPKEFVMLFGKSAKEYWRQVRGEIFM